VLTINSVKILHAVRSSITATAELLVFPYCLFVSNSQVIGCEDRLRNDLNCVDPIHALNLDTIDNIHVMNYSYHRS